MVATYNCLIMCTFCLSTVGCIYIIYLLIVYCILQNRWGTLHTAARYGHVPVVDTLIKLGADVDTISIVS